MHLGGDELPAACWTGSPEINDYLVKHNWNVSDAFSYFVNRTHELAKKYGKIPVGWNEVWAEVGDRLDKSAII